MKSDSGLNRFGMGLLAASIVMLGLAGPAQAITFVPPAGTALPDISVGSISVTYSGATGILSAIGLLGVYDPGSIPVPGIMFLDWDTDSPAPRSLGMAPWLTATLTDFEFIPGTMTGLNEFRFLGTVTGQFPGFPMPFPSRIGILITGGAPVGSLAEIETLGGISGLITTAAIG